MSLKIQEATSKKCFYHWEKRKTKCKANQSTNQGQLPTKVTPDIDFTTDEPAVQCDLLVVKNAFADDCN